MRAEVKQIDLTARAYHCVVKLARTFAKPPRCGIADLAGEESIQLQILAAMLQHRLRV